MYGILNLSHAAWNSKMHFITDPHLIWLPVGSFNFPSNHSFWNCSFFPLPACLTLCRHCLHSDLSCPSLPMNYTTGPWALQKVKTRLRREQIEREQAASERYRQLEAKRNEQTIVGTSWSNCILIVLVSCCFLLLALLLAALLCIVFLLNKDNEER